MRARIGIISDTHGLVRPEALSALQDCDVLLHAGDIGKVAVLDALRECAPVHAVRGNIDRSDDFSAIPAALEIEVGGLAIHLVHRPQDIDLAIAARVDLVVCGHSHRPCIDEVAGTLRVNPGSAGPRRFSLPVSVAVVEVRDGTPEARLVTLEIPPRPVASRRRARR